MKFTLLLYRGLKNRSMYLDIFLQQFTNVSRTENTKTLEGKKPSQTSLIMQKEKKNIASSTVQLLSEFK